MAHSEMIQRLGDERGRALLREHEQLVRAVLGAHHGVEVKTLGDGFMAWFRSVTTAVACAVELQRQFEARNHHADEPLHLRVGLDAGEPIPEDGDFFGATVITAARIAAHAGPGEVLVPGHVRHLVAGKGSEFTLIGNLRPKGSEEPLELWRVEWRAGRG